MNSHNYPVIYKAPPNLKLGIVYNPFMLNDVSWSELVYDQDKTLADYMEGVPDDAMWALAVNGEPVPREDWATVKPKPLATLCLVRIPEGSGGGKNILRMVAMIALVVVAAVTLQPEIAGLAGVFTTGLSAATLGVIGSVGSALAVTAGSLLINAVIGSGAPQQLQSSPSYGIDGPKNTSKEGVPVPVVYGEFQLGGNIVDLYTQNVYDDTYLFMRTVLNDAVSQNVSNILINGQTLSSFQDVEYRVRLGNEGQDGNLWFSKATSLNTVQQRITPLGVTYQTIDAVDRISLNISFPMGMSYVGSGGGNPSTNNVQLILTYQEIDDHGNPIGGWNPFPIEAQQPVDTSTSTGIFTLPLGANSAKFLVLPTTGPGGSYSVQGFYRGVSVDGLTTGAWVPYHVMSGSGVPSWQTGTANAVTGVINPATQQRTQLTAANNYGLPTATAQSFTVPTLQYNFSFPSTGLWEVMFTGGSIQDSAPVKGQPANSATGLNVPGTANPTYLQVLDLQPFSVSYTSQTLPHARYQVKVQRVRPEDSSATSISQCWLTDVGEINNENVQYLDVTTLSLKIKLTNQLSGIPTLTALVQGCSTNIYDEEGNVTGNAWNQNPAWIVADILTDPKHGGNFASNKIDWPKFVEWAEFCDANGLKFNAVFDFVTTLWDAIQSVGKVGHAMIVPSGTRYSLSIDQPSDPVMVFTGSNMYADTFTKTWTNLTDVANEVQQQYYDENAAYRQKTIRLPNAQAQARGDVVKTATTSGFGINNAAQATSEAEYQTRLNSYINNGVQFDAPLESIAMSIGDVALVQHDSVQYADGVGGRIDAGSTTSVVQLDRPVTMQAGFGYAIMIIQDAVLRYSPTITAISGNWVTVTGLPTPNLDHFSRLIQGATDYEVIRVIDQGSGTYRLTLDDASGLLTGVCGLWDTNVIQEYPVVANVGENQMSVTLVTPIAAPPNQYANFLFGQVATVKNPYRLRGIAAGDDLYRRTLKFQQYDARVYGPGTWGTPRITADPPRLPGQVTNLYITYTQYPNPDQQHIPVTVNWTAPVGSSPYGGADVYVSVNGAAYISAGSVQSVTSFQGIYNRGDAVTFKVVGFDTFGNRASSANAPTTTTTVNVYVVSTDMPYGLGYSVPVYNALAVANVTWTPPASADANMTYRVELLDLGNADYAAMVAAIAANPATPAFSTAITSDTGYEVIGTTPDTQMNIPSLAVGDFSVRVRSEKGYSFSDWAYLPMKVTAPGIPVQLTNFRLNHGTAGLATDTFSGPDAIWTWDDILTQAQAMTGPAAAGLPFYWNDYEVQILTADGATLLRTEYVTAPTYTYTFAKNVIDSASLGTVHARRSFQINVTLRGAQGQVSTPTVQTVSNPVPALVAGTIVTGVQTLSLTYTPPSDPDFAGVIVWASQTSGFTPGPANLVYQNAGTALWNVTPYTTYFYRYAFYDQFGTDGIIISNESSVASLGVGAAGIDPTVIAKLDGLVTTYGTTTSAATSATAAQAAATAANTARTAANTAASNALSYALLASSSGNVSLVTDPVFANWSSGTYPSGWTGIGSGATPTKATGVYSSYAMTLAGSAAGIDCGAVALATTNTALGVGQLAVSDWVVLEADVTLNSGALTAAGLVLAVSNASGTLLSNYTIDFTIDTDVSGVAQGAGVAGSTYHFRKLLQITDATASQGNLYAYAHWSGFGHPETAANSVTFQRASVRFASGAEVSAGVGIVDATSALAAVSTEQAAREAADNSLATSITNLTTNLGTTNANVTSESSARSSADAALGVRIDTVTANLGTANSNISNEAVARANADGVLASQINTLQATTMPGAISAAIANQATVQATKDAALSNTISNVTASVYGPGGGQSLLTNSTFGNWPSGTYPAGWANWGPPTGPVVKSAGTYSPNAMTITSVASTDSGGAFQGGGALGIGQITENQWFVLEADITLVSGSLQSAGLLFLCLDLSGALVSDTWIDFFADADITGTAIGAGVAGTTYRYRKLVQAIGATVTQGQIYCLAHWSGFGHAIPAATNTITFQLASVRLASSGEIAGTQALGISTANTSAISSEALARTTADSALGSRIDTLTSTTMPNAIASAISSAATTQATKDAALSTTINSVAAYAYGPSAGQALNANPIFGNWPSGQTLPSGWSDWSNGVGQIAKTTGSFSPNAATFSRPAGADVGLQITGGGLGLGQIQNNTWYVFEADIVLNAGSLYNSGLYVNVCDATTPLHAILGLILDFATDLDTSGVANAAGTPGKTYHFSKMVAITGQPTASQAVLYMMAGWSGFGHGASTAANITFQRALFRAASAAEVAGNQALSTSNANSASITATTNALATLTGQTYATYTLVANASGNIASMRLLAAGGPTTVSAVIFEAATFEIKSGTNPGIAPFVYNSSTGTLYLEGITVTNANIANATIGSAQIANLSVGTQHIVGNAVTNTVSAFTSSSVSNYSGTVMISVTITTTGGPVTILGNGNYLSAGSGSGPTAIQLFYTNLLYGTGGYLDGFTPSYSMPIMFTHTPPAGTYTYYIRGAGSPVYANYNNLFLQATEYKK